MWFWRPRSNGDEGADPVPVPAVSNRADVPPGDGRRDAAPSSGPAGAPPGVMRATGRMPGLPGRAGPGGGGGGGGALRPTRLSREVRRLLESLGRTRSEVAATLTAAGVRAAPRDPRRTPVSLYVCAVIGADPNVKSVTVNERSVLVELRAWWRSAVSVDLPFAVREFMIAFNQRCYPALLLPGHRAGA